MTNPKFLLTKNKNKGIIMKSIQIFTDGACSGNPGNGGYGAILKYGEHIKEICQGYRLTTNNRMELLAAITALEMLKEPCFVELYSDSKYLVDSINLGWLKKWQANGWKKSGSEKAKNIDLLTRLVKQLEVHDVKFIWVKGHDGHPENERCDTLATGAAKSGNLIEDAGYNNQ